MLIKKYKIPIYDVRKIATAKNRLGIPETEPLDEKYADQFFIKYMRIPAPEQHIPEDEQEYDLVWVKE
jgi:hypothetical protein